MQKECAKCKALKDQQEFDRNLKRPDGLQTYCRKCKKEYDAQYYVVHKARTLARNKKNKLSVLEWLAAYKQTLKCIRCGENHPATLDFHHTNPDEKDGDIATLVQHYSIERLKREIAKCIVLCSNCHRKEHYGR
jgi:hypothetical protein